MKGINHNEEIRATRVGGFGGSDAAMVLAMAERIKDGQPLTTAQKHRMLQLKGLETRPDFDSPEIQAGRAFEDEVAKRLDANEWDRETYLTPNPNSSQAVRQNFKVFAHADFVSMRTGTVRECKWSRKYDHYGLAKQYAAQLQWYYMLGAPSVMLTTDTEGGRNTTDVARDDKMVTAIVEALETIDEAFASLDLTISEKGVNELPPEVAALVHQVETLKKAAAELDEELKAATAQLLAYMDDNQLNKVWTDTASMTYTAPSSSVGFDAKSFQKEYPDLYASFLNKITKKSGYITVKINK